MSSSIARNFEREGSFEEGYFKYTFQALKNPGFLDPSIVQFFSMVFAAIVIFIGIFILMMTAGVGGFLMAVVVVFGIRYFMAMKKPETLEVIIGKVGKKVKFKGHEVDLADMDGIGIKRVSNTAFANHSILFFEIRGSKVTVAVGKNDVINGVYNDLNKVFDVN